jgi:hypothetical protein
MNHILSACAPGLYDDVRKLKKSNRALRRKLKAYQKTQVVDPWQEADQYRMQNVQQLRMAGTYVQSAAEEYMNFVVEKNQAKSRYVEECGDMAIFFSAEFAKIVKSLRPMPATPVAPVAPAASQVDTGEADLDTKSIDDDGAPAEVVEEVTSTPRPGSVASGGIDYASILAQVVAKYV